MIEVGVCHIYSAVCIECGLSLVELYNHKNKRQGVLKIATHYSDTQHQFDELSKNSMSNSFFSKRQCHSTKLKCMPI